MESSHDGTTYFAIYDPDSAASWTVNVNGVGTYEFTIPASLIPGNKYRLSYACGVAAGTIGIDGISWENPAGSIDITYGDVHADIGAIQVSTDTLDNLVLAEDAAHATGEAGVLPLAVRQDTHGTLVDTDGDRAPLQVNADGAVYSEVTVLPGGLTGYAEDAAHTDGDIGVLSLTVRSDNPTGTAGTDGDYQPALTDDHGCLHVNPQLHETIDACNATTGWSVLSDDTDNLATATNHVFGTASLSFDKVDGTANTVFAGIQKTVASTDLDKYIEHSNGFFLGSMYLPSIADIDYVWFRAGTDSSNYNEWRVYDSDLFAGQWLALRGNLGAPYTTAGNGWDSSAVTWIAIGAAFDAENDTLAGILVDALFVNSGMQVTAEISLASQVNTPNVNLHRVGGTPVTTNAGAVGRGTQRITLASDDPAVALLTTIDADTGSIDTKTPALGNAAMAASVPVTLASDDTNTVDLPNVIGTDGAAGPSKALSVAGTEAGGNLQELLVDSDGHLQIDSLTLPGGLVGHAEDDVHVTADVGVEALAVRNDTLAALCDTDGDYAPLQVDADGALYTVDETAEALLTTIDADTSSIDGKTPALGTALMAASSPVTLATDDTLTVAANALLTTIDADTGSIDTKTPALGVAASAASSPVVLASDDAHLGAVGAAADVDGHVHGQLRFIGEAVDGLETSVTDIPNVIGTDGAAGPSKAVSVAGTDGSGNLQELRVDTNGNVGAIVTDGTTDAAVTAGLTALKVDLVGEGGAAIDATNPVFAELTDGAAAISSTNPLHVLPGNGTLQADFNAGASYDSMLVRLTDGTNLLSLSATGDVEVTGNAGVALATQATLATIDTDTGNIATNTTDLPNVIGTDGAAGPSKAISIAGTDGSGNLQELKTNTSGQAEVVDPNRTPLVLNYTGSGAIDVDTAIGAAWELLYISMHLSAAGTTAEDFTVVLDANDGVAYDTVAYALDLSTDSVTDLIISPMDQSSNSDQVPRFYEAGDELDIDWPNTESRTYGLRIVYRLI